MQKRLRRAIADFPGAFKIFEQISRNRLTKTTTPEIFKLIINPLFHCNLTNDGGFKNHEPEIRAEIIQLTIPTIICKLHSHLSDKSGSVVDLLLDNRYSIINAQRVINVEHELERAQVMKQKHIVAVYKV